jgi:hypothetical protein
VLLATLVLLVDGNSPTIVVATGFITVRGTLLDVPVTGVGLTVGGMEAEEATLVLVLAAVVSTGTTLSCVTSVVAAEELVGSTLVVVA